MVGSVVGPPRSRRCGWRPAPTGSTITRPGRRDAGSPRYLAGRRLPEADTVRGNRWTVFDGGMASFFLAVLTGETDPVQRVDRGGRPARVHEVAGGLGTAHAQARAARPCPHTRRRSRAARRLAARPVLDRSLQCPQPDRGGVEVLPRLGSDLPVGLETAAALNGTYGDVGTFSELAVDGVGSGAAVGGTGSGTSGAGAAGAGAVGGTGPSGPAAIPGVGGATAGGCRPGGRGRAGGRPPFRGGGLPEGRAGGGAGGRRGAPGRCGGGPGRGVRRGGRPGS
ncbi:hypothetical protein GA0115234_108847 [Streptomyces sp. DvalAA-43]|nr:hypothetical protein GA0115234_108847 [Streptomyces sp. DvalAA-43]